MKLGIKGIELQARGMDVLKGGKVLPFSIRTLGDMRPVLMDSSVKGKDSTICYRMYRFPPASNGIRLDLTVLAPEMLGTEYNKTYGHYHPLAPSGQEYAEIYQVVSGKACMIFQKKDSSVATAGTTASRPLVRLGRSDAVRQVDDVIAVEMEEGEAVIVPPGYGHTFTNRGKGILITADLMYAGPERDYSEYKKLHGAAYYDTPAGSTRSPLKGDRCSLSDASKRIRGSSLGDDLLDGCRLTSVSEAMGGLVPNPAYGKLPRPRLLKAEAHGDIYDALLKNPAAFDFLIRPELTSNACKQLGLRDIRKR